MLVGVLLESRDKYNKNDKGECKNGLCGILYVFSVRMSGENIRRSESWMIQA